MKCQRCKEREANVQIMQQISGKKPQNFYLCDVCARELGISMPSFPVTGKMSSNPFALLGNMFQSNLGLGADEISEKPSVSCSQCNMTFEEFKKTGFLGCPSCYEAFSCQMDPIFSRTQMGNKHAGRKPGSKSTKSSTDKTAPEDNIEIDFADNVNLQGKEEKTPKLDGSDAKPSVSKSAKKRKISAQLTPTVLPDGESEELIALEKQHINRLVEEKRTRLSEAVSDEDYLKAAKIRDEISVLLKSKEG